MATQAADTRTERSMTLRERISMNGGFTPYFLVLPTIILILVIASLSHD